MENFCPACGTHRADGAGFCGQCGHRYEVGVPGAGPHPEPEATAFDQAPPPPLLEQADSGYAPAHGYPPQQGSPQRGELPPQAGHLPQHPGDGRPGGAPPPPHPPYSARRRPPIGLIVIGAVVATAVLAIGILEATETINLFDSGSTASTSQSGGYGQNMSFSQPDAAGMPPPSPPLMGQEAPLENRPVPSGGSMRMLPANDSSNDVISPEWMAGTWSSSCGGAGARTLRFTPGTAHSGSVQSARGMGSYYIGGGTPLTISLTMGGRTVNGNIARMNPETMAITLPGSPAQVLRWCGP